MRTRSGGRRLEWRWRGPSPRDRRDGLGVCCGRRWSGLNLAWAVVAAHLLHHEVLVAAGVSLVLFLRAVDLDDVTGLDVGGNAGEGVDLAVFIAADFKAARPAGDAALDGVMRFVDIHQDNRADDDRGNYAYSCSDDFAGARAYVFVAGDRRGRPAEKERTKGSKADDSHSTVHSLSSRR